MTSKNVETFWDWFDELRDAIPIRELERRADAPRGRISNVYRNKLPSALVCQTIAKSLNIDADEVFRNAGLLPLLSASENEEEFYQQLWDIVKQMSVEERRELFEYARYRLQREQEEKR